MLRGTPFRERRVIQLAADVVLEMDVVLPLTAEPTLSKVLHTNSNG